MRLANPKMTQILWFLIAQLYQEHILTGKKYLVNKFVLKEKNKRFTIFFSIRNLQYSSCTFSYFNDIKTFSLAYITK